MDEFTKSSITKLARKAGVKTLSDECYSTISNLIAIKIDDILKDVIICNSERRTKTLMIDDLVKSLSLRYKHITKSNDLN
jgi:histone H3/H4